MVATNMTHNIHKAILNAMSSSCSMTCNQSTDRVWERFRTAFLLPAIAGQHRNHEMAFKKFYTKKWLVKSM